MKKNILTVFTALLFYGVNLIANAAGVPVKIDNSACLEGQPSCGNGDLRNWLSSMGELEHYAPKEDWFHSNIRYAIQFKIIDNWSTNKFNYKTGSIPGAEYYSIDLSNVEMNVKVYKRKHNGSTWVTDTVSYQDSGRRKLSDYYGWNGWISWDAGTAPAFMRFQFWNDDNLEMRVNKGKAGKYNRSIRLPWVAIEYQILKQGQNGKWEDLGGGTKVLTSTFLKTPITYLNDRSCKILVNGNDSDKVSVAFKPIEANAVGKLEEQPFNLNVKCAGYSQSGIAISGTQVNNELLTMTLSTVNKVNIDGVGERIALQNEKDKINSNSLYVEGAYSQGECGSDVIPFGDTSLNRARWESGSGGETNKLFKQIWWRLCKKDREVISHGDYTGQAKIKIKYH